MPDPSTLVKRWQSGDLRAAEGLFNMYRDGAFRLAFGLLGDARDAEEAAQDALTYALTHISRYDPGRASFRTWLHMITVSRCRDRQRRKRLPTLSLGHWLGHGGDARDPAPSPERQATLSETRSEVWRAVQALSPTLREAILLRYWADHTYQEMAEILGCPLRTAQSRVRLACEKLEGLLSHHATAGLWEEEVR